MVNTSTALDVAGVAARVLAASGETSPEAASEREEAAPSLVPVQQPEVEQPEVITLCGSIRFAAQHLAAHRRLSLEGRVVLLPALPGPEDDLRPADVELLAALHRKKIDMSDRVHIVNPGGYVGTSTASELAYAEVLGKAITYEHDVR